MIATMPCGNVSSEMFVELDNSISMTVSQMTTHRRKQTLYYGAILVVYLLALRTETREDLSTTEMSRKPKCIHKYAW